MKKPDNLLKQYLTRLTTMGEFLSDMIFNSTEISYFSYQDEIILSFTSDTELNRAEAEKTEAADRLPAFEEYGIYFPADLHRGKSRTLILFSNFLHFTADIMSALKP